MLETRNKPYTNTLQAINKNTNKMANFDKNSKEYISNGHYKIDGVDFMSVWTFKKKHNIEPNNNNANGSEGQDLNKLGFNIHSSTPDFGGFSTIYIYPLEELEKYYGV